MTVNSSGYNAIREKYGIEKSPAPAEIRQKIVLDGMRQM